MKIIGKYNGKLVIKCDGGHFHLYNTYGTGGGCFGCEHEKGETYFDFVNLEELNELKEVEYIQLDITINKDGSIQTF